MDSTSGAVVTTLLKVQKGGEVRITYGAKGGHSLLRHYGFSLPSNTEPDGSSNDTRAVAFSLAPPTEPRAKRRKGENGSSGEGTGKLRASTHVHSHEPTQIASQNEVRTNAGSHSGC